MFAYHLLCFFLCRVKWAFYMVLLRQQWRRARYYNNTRNKRCRFFVCLFVCLYNAFFYIMTKALEKKHISLVYVRARAYGWQENEIISNYLSNRNISKSYGYFVLWTRNVGCYCWLRLRCVCASCTNIHFGYFLLSSSSSLLLLLLLLILSLVPFIKCDKW